MKRYLTLVVVPLVVSVVTLTSILTPQAHAISTSAFNPGHIIDDGIFYDSSSMSVTQIQAFLNSKVPTCDTQGTGSYAGTTRAQYGTAHGYPPPYICLKDYYENPTTHVDNFSGSIPAGAQSAAQIIYNAGITYSINPQVLIVLLQKEQGLVTDDWPAQYEYDKATGYGCPDTSGCNSAYYGFYNQVNQAAAQFRRYANSPNNYNYVPGPGNYVQYSPTASCGGTYLTIQNQATASLYDYTPYQPNAAALAAGYGTGNSCSSYGNRNFWLYFNDWFGSSLAAGYSYSYVTSSKPSLTLEPGQVITGNSVTIRNAGTATWYADGSAPSGQHPVRLALRGYQNSPFADPSDPAWLGTSNQIKMTPASVAPGQTATFTFNLKGPTNKVISSYSLMYFVPVVDGVMFMPDANMGFGITNRVASYDVTSPLPSSLTILPNEIKTETVTLKNTGSGTWYADGSAPSGYHPLRLAVSGYQNSPFADPSDPAWLGTSNQIKMTPASVAPGQTATFTFNLKGPLKQTSQAFKLVPVMDGVSFASTALPSTTISTPQPNYSYSYVSATNPPSTMKVGTSASVSLTLKNTGNVVWTNNQSTGAGTTRLRLMMRRPDYHASVFYDSSAGSNWLIPNQIQYTGPTVSPGQTARFTFTWHAPEQPGSYTDYFSPVMDGYYVMADIGMGFAINVTPN